MTVCTISVCPLFAHEEHLRNLLLPIESSSKGLLILVYNICWNSFRLCVFIWRSSQAASEREDI